jgi:hypothetical protein
MRKKIKRKDELYKKNQLIEEFVIFFQGAGPVIPEYIEKHIREVLCKRTRHAVKQILRDGITLRDNLNMAYHTSGISLNEFILSKVIEIKTGGGIK